MGVVGAIGTEMDTAGGAFISRISRFKFLSLK